MYYHYSLLDYHCKIKYFVIELCYLEFANLFRGIE